MEKNMKKEYGNLCFTLRDGESVVVGDGLVVVRQLKNKELRLLFRFPKETKIQRTVTEKKDVATNKK
jgi:sRNA-binding carbon storage regulator CsrA